MNFAFNQQVQQQQFPMNQPQFNQPYMMQMQQNYN